MYLKTKKMTDISQTQAGFKAKSRRNPLWIPRLFNAKSRCVCRNRRYFRLSATPWVQPIPRDLEQCSRTNSGQVSWLKAQRLPPPSQAMLSDRCKCTLAAGSLITVTRSCGICTRFPFTLFHALNGGMKRHLLSYSVLRCKV